MHDVGSLGLGHTLQADLETGPGCVEGGGGGWSAGEVQVVWTLECQMSGF